MVKIRKILTLVFSSSYNFDQDVFVFLSMFVQYSCILIVFCKKRQPLLQEVFYRHIMFNVKIKQKQEKLGDINAKQQIIVMQKQVTSKVQTQWLYRHDGVVVRASAS